MNEEKMVLYERSESGNGERKPCPRENGARELSQTTAELVAERDRIERARTLGVKLLDPSRLPTVDSTIDTNKTEAQG